MRKFKTSRSKQNYNMRILTALSFLALVSDVAGGPIIESDSAKEILIGQISGGKTLFIKYVS
jgi:hypothetical protein